jgi:predicted RNase H-like HicB family nuclease
MLTEYVEEALRRARYDKIEDEEPYYGEVGDLQGVWATGKTLEECRSNLKEVIEGWILLSIKRGFEIPALGKNEIKEVPDLQESDLVA